MINTSTNTSTNNGAPMRAAEVFKLLATSNDKAFKGLFLQHAATLESTFTGRIQLVNSLQRMKEQAEREVEASKKTGKKPTAFRPSFGRILKDAEAGATVAQAFANEIHRLMAVKDPAPAKPAPSKLDGILKALPALTLKERASIMEALQVLQGHPLQAVEEALI